MSTTPPWKRYEDAARQVLGEIGQVAGIELVEGLQTLEGKSGAKWAIDGKAVRDGGKDFWVVEVRRHTTRGVEQEAVAAIAFRIEDLGASGGIVVSPLDLQSGAAVVAKATNIVHFKLSEDSTPTDYLAEFMGRRFYGVSAQDAVYAPAFADAEVIRGGGAPPTTSSS